MKKHLLLLFTAVLFILPAGLRAQDVVQIGSGTLVSYAYPIHSSSAYSMSQQIYTATEVGRSGSIYSIAFYNARHAITRNIDIYMTHTNLSEFNDHDDWVTVTATELVYSGNVEFLSNEWTTIELSTPFTYNGVDNLLITVDDNSGWSTSNEVVFLIYPTTNTTTMFRGNTWNSGTNPINYYGYPVTGKNQIQLSFTPIECFKPVGFRVSDVGSHSATLSWIAPDNAYEYQCQYSTSADFSTNTLSDIVASDTSVQITGLLPDTTYYVRVRNSCGTAGFSAWSNTLSFKTFEAFDSTLVRIGHGDLTSSIFPVCNIRNYGLTQQIYTADEIGQAGTIQSLEFYNTGSAMTRNIDIYMVHTDKEKFDHDSDWVSVTTGDLVFSGDVEFLSDEWSTITLSTPFAYNGGDNLLLYVDDNSGLWSTSFRYFLVFPAPDQGLCKSFDRANLDLTNVTNYHAVGGVNDVKNQIRLGMAPSPCSPPTSLTFSNITQSSALLSWTQRGGAGEWQVCMDGDEDNAVTVTTNSYTLTGLMPLTTYTVKTRALCGSDTTLWRKASFTTLPSCFPPTNLTVSNLNINSVSLGWTENNTATEWQVCINDDEANATTVTTNPYTIPDLTSGTTYTVKVRANCGGSDGVSPWSNPKSFSSGNGIVEIIDQSGTSEYLPTDAVYSYSMTQQIYTAEEIGQWGTIYSLAFYSNSNAIRDLDIYMTHTNKTDFSSGNDWVTVTTADLVYSGSVSFTGDAWTRIDFSTPFFYNGTDNVVIVVDDNSMHTNDDFKCRYFNTSYQSLYIYSSSTNHDPTNPGGYTGSRLSQKNWIQLGFLPVCNKPSHFKISHINQNSASLSWTENGTATEWQICVNGDETNPITVTSNPYMLTGLTPTTNYSVKIRASCGNLNEASLWTNVQNFTTQPVPASPLVPIGNGTSATNTLPVNTNRHYSLSQQIYTQAEIGQSGEISSVAFYNTGSAVTRNIDIYMLHIGTTTFSNYIPDAWVSAKSADLVFSGNVDFVSGDWTTINLQVPFSYNGFDNLLLVVDDNTASSTNNIPFRTFPTTGQAIQVARNDNNFEPALMCKRDIPEARKENEKNQIQLGFTLTVCYEPTNLTHNISNQNDVTLTWESNATSFNVNYKKTTDTLWQQTSTSGNTITLCGLGNANYEARVKAVCDPGVSESDWVETSFTLFDIQSNANWYAYTQTSTDHPEWERKFISFPMQDLNTVDTASETFYDPPVAITYANGYVWSCFYDYNTSYINLYRAPLHNDTKTIGNFAIVKENFELDYIPSMAYNPLDGKIYYLRGDQKLLSFDPSNPNTVTEVGNYTEDFEKIAINGSGEAFCFDYYTEELYRIRLTDATTTLVGSTPEIVNIAFDQVTDELFCTKFVGAGEMLYLIDTATALTQEIGFIGGDTTMMIHTMFMVGNTANICYAPENLTISSIGMHRATLHWDADSNDVSWIVEYSTVPDFTGATSVTVSTNSCQLSGLNAGTNYYVRVKNDCGTNSTSDWTNSSFHTEICPAADQCAITYELRDTWGDSWNGCAINVVDVATDIVIGTLTMTTNDGDTLSGTLPVCDGRAIRFEWVNGYYAEETSYTIFSTLGDTLFSGSDTMSAPVTYTVNCPANPNIVEIGSCNGGSDYLPSHSSSNYSFSQQIYTASEINRSGTISGISFYNNGTTQTRNYDMYLVHTNKSAFDHNLDWISTTPADLVFSGPIEMAAGTWTEIALDVPFAYNGTDNILLVMNDKTGNSATGMSCHTFHTTAIEAIYGYRDGSGYDPMFPHSILGDYNFEKNCVRLNFGTNCTKPANLTVSENGMNQATIVWDNNSSASSWIVEYSVAADFSGATSTTVTTNSCIITGLTPETEYHVRVKADCGADGESYWNIISFITNPCPLANQCEITYQLGDSYGDGWTGNAINVVDVTSNIVLDTWTIEYGDSASGSLFVCDGREIRFEWVSGYDPNEISYRVYDANGVQILNGVGAFLTPVTYMVNCTSSPCPTPDNIAVSNFSGGIVTVSWTENGSATSWQICLDGDEANPISVNTNPYTLSGLDSTVFHNIKVRANCGSDYSFWSTPVSFAQVQSTGNWYAYIHSCPNNTDLRNKFVSFSAQDPANASAASNVIPNVLAATYANGEVWFFNEDNTTLYKAPIDNNTKTMGVYETVATNFDGNNNIASMSYNPVDGRIYYILYTPSQTVKLKSFAPSSINDVTEIGTFNNYAFSIAIDNNGNAYCTDLMTGNLCQVNLTNATSTPVGDLGFSSTMPVIAFDMNTGELLMGQLESSGDNGIYLVNPATAEKQFVGHLGGGTGANISGLFMVSESAPIVTCPAPTDLVANNISDEHATLAWTENGNASEWQICINGDESNLINVTSNPYTLNGLTPETPYTVKVRANCGSDGTSDWSNEVSFSTEPMVIPPFFYIDGEDSICQNQTTVLTVMTNMGTDYLWSTGETSQSITVPVGTYYVTVTNNGNEVAYGDFTVGAKETYNITLNDTICKTELPYPWNGITFIAAGDTTLTLTAVNGCDSVVTLHLTVNTPTIGDTTAVACDFFDWYEHTNITASCDNLTHTFTNASGCDSVVTLHLTINHSNTGDTTAIACDSFDWYEHTNITASCDNLTHTFTNANGCDSVVTLHLTVNHSNTGDTTATAQDSFTWYEHANITQTGDYTHTFVNAAGCDSVVTLHLTINYSNTGDTTAIACDSFDWYEHTNITASCDNLTHTFTNANGCDSVVTLHLTVNHSNTGDTTAIACNSFDWYEHTNITASCDNLTHTFTNANGCDSVVTLHLTINHSNTGDTTAIACDSFDWYEHTNITASCDNLTHTFTNASGCDSVVTLHLTINHSNTGDTTAIACDSFEWYEHTNITASCDNLTHTFTNASGCDSVVTLHLTINHSNTGDTTAIACDSFDWYEHTNITANCDNLTHTFTNANGCDSVVTLHLTINHSNTGDTTATAQDSFTWYEHTNITQTGDYTHTFVNAAGCDSVVTLHLTIGHSSLGDTSAVVCDSFDWYEHTGITHSGDYTHTFVNAAGYDSVVTLHLTINHSSTGDTTATAQDSFTWYEHANITQTGNYTHTFVNAAGCDSVVTLHLTIGQSSLGDTSAVACDSFDWYEHTGITQSGDYTHTFVNAAGYDSVVTLHLTVNYSNTGDTTAIVCDSFDWYEHTGITQSGDYTHTFTNTNGCDSVVTLHLTINHSNTGDTTAIACDSFDWYEHTNITASCDNLTHTFTNTNGCDSVVTLHLTINHSNTGDTTAIVCDSFNWYEHTGITQSGDYTHTFTNTNGCDSVVTLHLTINHAVSSEFTIETTDSYYIWNGQAYCVSGDYEQTLTSANGCDSIVTLHLTINVGIDEYDFAASMTVYPNPTTGILNIQIANIGTPISEFLLYDIYGKLVDKVRLQNSDSTETAQIDLSELSNGIYFVKAVADGKVVAVRKVVKQ